MKDKATVTKLEFAKMILKVMEDEGIAETSDGFVFAMLASKIGNILFEDDIDNNINVA